MTMTEDPSTTLTCSNVDETLALGRRLGGVLRPGDVLALTGPLGAGKTTLMRGIAAGAQVADLRQVTSPTFVIINEYETTGPGAPAATLQHIDAYRLHGADDLDALGFDELLESAPAIIEWADRVAELLPADHLRVVITATGSTSRAFTLAPTGPRSRSLLADALPNGNLDIDAAGR